MRTCRWPVLFSFAAMLALPLQLAGQSGELHVDVATSGFNLDSDGYVIALDTLRRAVGLNGSAVFTDVKPGINTTELLDVAQNCVVPDGNPRKVVVRIGEVTRLSFDVVCGASRSPAQREVAPADVPGTEQEVVEGQEVAPQQEVVPQQDVAPVEDVAPEQEVVQGQEVAPQQEMAPDEEVAPPQEEVVSVEEEAALAVGADSAAPAEQRSAPEGPAPDEPLTPPTRTMGEFSAGQWVAIIEPPEFPAYPVNVTFYSDGPPGSVVGVARYDAPTWSCSYELMLESVSDDDLVVAQRLTSGSCPDGNLVVFTREEDSLRGEWLRPDRSAWFGVVFSRSR